jgi:hypothetical protein
LNVAGNPWRHAAREVIGTANYQAGDLPGARDAFAEIQQDAETPQDLWLRSGMMVALIDGQLAAPGTQGSGAAPTEAPPSGGAPATLTVPKDAAPAGDDAFAPETTPLAPAAAPDAQDSTPAPEPTTPAPAPTPAAPSP